MSATVATTNSSVFSNDTMQSYFIYAIAVIVLIYFLIYLFNLVNLSKKECSQINKLYPSIDTHLRSTTGTDYLSNYYVKTAYNACSGGSYANDFVDICNLKAIIRQGVRCFDFEIYSIDDEPAISTSIYKDNYYVKETLNYVLFADAMNVLFQHGLQSTGTCPNGNDPLFIHLRCKSTNKMMYANLAKIFEKYVSNMLGAQYSYNNGGKPLGSAKLSELMGKIILIMDKSNPSFKDNEQLMEYVNLESNSNYMRLYTFSNVVNNPDIDELTNYNKQGLTIVIPDLGSNPTNPSATVCRASGCQFIAMRFQVPDENLAENTLFFDQQASAFVLKPDELRYIPVTADMPTPQNPNYSYADRTISSNYYSFKI